MTADPNNGPTRPWGAVKDHIDPPMTDEHAKPGDVIQIDPTHDDTFGGCFAIAKEVKGWGVSLCYVTVPGQGDAYYRIKHVQYCVIGSAEWTHKEPTDE